MSTCYYACENEHQQPSEGLFLGKRASGWVFQFKWHDWTHRDDKDKNHPYRNIDELEEFVKGKVIKNQFSETIEPEKFVEMAKQWHQREDKTPSRSERVHRIGGYYFRSGDWL